MELFCFDAETGGKIWKFNTAEATYCYPGNCQSMLIHQGKIYFTTGEPSVCCLDAFTGSVIWKCSRNVGCNVLKMSGEYLLVGSNVSRKQTFCFNNKTGDKLWEYNWWYGGVFDNIVCLYGFEPNGLCIDLVDISSGEVLKKLCNGFIGYKYIDGVFYYNIIEQKTLVALDTKTYEEIPLITCDDRINALDVFEQGVIALLYDTSDEYYVYADTLMFIDKTGNILWEYSYPEGSISTYETKTFISDSILFIFRGEGFIDVFNVKTGELLWGAEVRGHEIKGFDVYNNSLYVSATDGMFYCFPIDTGKILWVIDSESTVTSNEGREAPEIFCIEGGMFYIFIEDGNICVISVN